MTLALEHRAPADSIISRWDARWKLAALLLSIALIAVLRSPVAAGVALALGLLFAAVARLPTRWFLIRFGTVSLALSPFLLILPLTADDGWRFALVLFLRGLAITTLALVLLGSTPLPVTLYAAGRLGVPGLLVHLALLSYRYIFLIAEEFDRLRTALRVRGFRNRMNGHSYRTIGRVTGTLLVRGADRADRVGHAMRCRGFDGSFRCLHEFQTRRIDAALFLAVVVIAAGILVIDLRGIA